MGPHGFFSFQGCEHLGLKRFLPHPLTYSLLSSVELLRLIANRQNIGVICFSLGRWQTLQGLVGWGLVGNEIW